MRLTLFCLYISLSLPLISSSQPLDPKSLEISGLRPRFLSAPDIGPATPISGSKGSKGGSGSGSGSGPEVEEEQEEAQPAAVVVGNVGSGAIKAMSVLASQSPSFVSIVGLSEMMQYIRYLRIYYPQKLIDLFEELNSNPLSLPINIEMPEGFYEKFPDRVLPDVFEYYELDSSFLLNYWDTLVTLVIISGVLLGLVLLKYSTENKYKTFSSVIGKILKKVKWNLLLMYFCSSLGEIAFYGVLDLRTILLDSALAIVSFFLIIVAFFGLAVVVAKCFMIALARKKSKDEKEFEGFEILFDGCKDGSWGQLMYMFVMFSRQIICNLVIAGPDGAPLAQAIVLVIFSLMMSVYCIFYRPLKDIWEMIITVISELLLLVVNICVLIYAVLDHNNFVSENCRDKMAEIIIIISSIFSICAIVFMAIQLAVMLFELVKNIRRLKAQGKSISGIIKALLFGEDEEQEVTNVKQHETLEMKRGMKLRQPTQSGHFSTLNNTSELELSTIRMNQVVPIGPVGYKEHPFQYNRRITRKRRVSSIGNVEETGMRSVQQSQEMNTNRVDINSSADCSTENSRTLSLQGVRSSQQVTDEPANKRRGVNDNYYWVPRRIGGRIKYPGNE